MVFFWSLVVFKILKKTFKLFLFSFFFLGQSCVISNSTYIAIISESVEWEIIVTFLKVAAD